MVNEKFELRRNLHIYMKLYNFLGIQIIDLSQNVFKLSKFGVIMFLFNISFCIFLLYLNISFLVTFSEDVNNSFMPLFVVLNMSRLAAISFSIIYVILNVIYSRKLYNIIQLMENLDDFMIKNNIKMKNNLRIKFLLATISKNFVLLIALSLNLDAFIQIFFLYVNLFFTLDIFSFILLFNYERIKSINNYACSSKSNQKSVLKCLEIIRNIMKNGESMFGIQVVCSSFSIIPIGVIIISISFLLFFDYHQSEEFQVPLKNLYKSLLPFWFQGHFVAFLGCLLCQKIENEFRRNLKILRKFSKLKNNQIYHDEFNGLEFLKIKLNFETIFKVKYHKLSFVDSQLIMNLFNFQIISIEFTYFIILLQFMTSISK